MKEVEETSDHKPTRATATAAAGSLSRAARELNLPKHFRLFAFQKKKKILIHIAWWWVLEDLDIFQLFEGQEKSHMIELL